MSNDTSRIKIHDIEIIKGVNVPINSQELSSLEKWYNKVRGKYLFELTDGDVARFIRQNLYLEYLIPEAITRLENSPLAGELYNGEILSMMSNVNSSFWIENIILREKVIALLDKRFDSYSMEWEYEGEEKEFENSVIVFLDKLKKLNAN
ncbi:MAG: contact-dependent growth inhibition system immunity protein [Desulfosporosinus sp.]|nr:contact-dependent growth inhibition system immunity protein [Desulfosporosinus sp.]